MGSAELFHCGDERCVRGFRQRRATGEGLSNGDERRVRGDLAKSDA
jgi:hypothetical protein